MRTPATIAGVAWTIAQAGLVAPLIGTARGAQRSSAPALV
jgi:hypothetical protein